MASGQVSWNVQQEVRGAFVLSDVDTDVLCLIDAERKGCRPGPMWRGQPRPPVR